MSRRRHCAPIALAIASLAITACASSSGDDALTDDGPDITLGTVPTDVPADDTDEATTGTDATDAATATEATDTDASADAGTGSESDTTEEAPETSLEPSPSADLPTESPDAEPEPVTTVPGPLPTPVAQLIDEGTFDEPVEATTHPHDQRLFVVEQGGTIVGVDAESSVEVLDLDAVDATTFTGSDGEQGLLGLAFHPVEDLAYVNFTNAEGMTVIAEFAVDAATAVLDTATYREVLTIEQPFANHNGGEIVFGPDDMLYIGTGDGGSADDPNRDALDPTSRLGKLLRIDPLGTDAAPFTVPADNPFVGVEGVDPTIWSLGLRNPWKFSFDALTGDLWIADVGQNLFEEVNLAPATDQRDAGRGLSFGWSAFEAADRFNDDQDADGHTLPVLSYEHTDGNCSISGGVVARNSSFADLNGWYVYGDFCTGTVWALDTTSVASTPDGPVGDPVVVELVTVPALAAVIEGPFGDIYTLSRGGAVQRLAPA